jgi:hypothetical protein
MQKRAASRPPLAYGVVAVPLAEDGRGDVAASGRRPGRRRVLRGCDALPGMNECERRERELQEAEAEFDAATKLSEIKRTAGRLHRARGR